MSKIDSKKKGNRAELALSKILSSRFNSCFTRSVGSGNRWSQVGEMTDSAKDCLVSDIVCPNGFRFTIECKSGYKDVNLTGVFQKGNATIDAFMQQVLSDAIRSGKEPLVAFKPDRLGWIAFLPTRLLPVGSEFDFRLIYRDWSGIALEKILALPDEFFFGG